MTVIVNETEHDISEMSFIVCDASLETDLIFFSDYEAANNRARELSIEGMSRFNSMYYILEVYHCSIPEDHTYPFSTNIVYNYHDGNGRVEWQRFLHLDFILRRGQHIQNEIRFE